MVSWAEFGRWLEAHDLPVAAVTKIELVPTRGQAAAGCQIHLRAETLKLDEHGRPVVVRRTGDAMTEVLVRPLVYLPDSAPTRSAE